MGNKTIPAKIEELGMLFNWIRDHLQIANLETPDLRKIELAIEEAVVNIIMHAYENKDGNIEINLSVFEKDRIEIQITDWGPEFNPLFQSYQAQTNVPVEEIEEGGLGIFLMRQYMDQVSYQREGSANILTLIKKMDH